MQKSSYNGHFLYGTVTLLSFTFEHHSSIFYHISIYIFDKLQVIDMSLQSYDIPNYNRNSQLKVKKASFAIRV